jgi:hypothetical protein
LIHRTPHPGALSFLRAKSQLPVTLAIVIVRLAAVKITRMIASEIVQKIGAIVRIAVREIGRSRTGAALIQGVRAAASSVGRVLHQLWLEVTGFIFLAIAAIGTMTAVREYGKYHAGTVGPGRLILAIVLALSFAWFGVSSFWRVNRSVARQRGSRIRSD